MRILHIDEMFHPFLGYQINVLPKFQVKQGHEVGIMTLYDYYPRVANVYDNKQIDIFDKEFTSETGVEIIRLNPRRYYFGRPLFDKEFVKSIHSFDPDIIMCHGNGTFTSIQVLLKRARINKPIMFDSHMLELAAQSKFHKIYTIMYRNIITPIIIKNHLYVVKTADDPYLNDVQGIPEELTPYLGFGTDTDLFYPNEQVKREMRKKYEIQGNEMVFLYTGKVSEEKGGKLLAEALFEEISSDNRKPVFVIVADYKSDYEKKVQALLRRSSNRVIMIPLQKYVDLPSFYQFADVMFFPKQCSLSFFDAQACGVPVILEDINININRVNCDNGSIFKSGSAFELREKIYNYLNMDTEKYIEQVRNSINEIQAKYSYDDIARNYTNLMNIAIDEYHQRRN